MKSLKLYWRECKERGVIAAVVIYAVAGFVVLLVTDLLALVVALPAWTHPLVLKTVLLGLPITIIISWIYNYQREPLPVGGRDLDAVWEDERVRRTSHLKTAGMVTAILALMVLWGAFLNLRTPRLNVRAGRVVVAPFDNATGADSLDDVGAVAADEIAQRLTQNRQLNIVPYSSIVAYATAAPLRPGSSWQRSLQVARGVGANYVVWGGYYRRGAALMISGQVTDAKSGDLVANIAAAAGSDAGTAIASFRENAARVVAQLLSARSSIGARDLLPVANPDAHATFTDALRHYVAQDYEGTISRLKAAAHADSTFLVARIWLARVLAETGRLAAADTIARELEPRRARLSAYDRAQLDYVQAYSTSNISLRYGASSMMTMIAPPSDDAQRLLALDALAWNHPREARNILLSLDPAKGWMRGWPGYYVTLAASYHLIGHYRDEEKIINDGLKRYPYLLDLWIADCRVRAALGKTDKEWWRIKYMQGQVRGRNTLTPGNALTRCGEELLAHGQPRYARYADSLAINWFAAHLSEVPAQLRSDYALALTMVNRPDVAYAEMQRVAQLPIAESDKPLLHARTAYFAALAGQRQQAFVLDSAANAGTDKYPSPYVTMERARVSAALGDLETAWTLLNDALSHGVPYAEPSATLLHADVTFRKFWDQPRFKALLWPGG